MLKLNDVTLVMVDCTNYKRSKFVLQHCMNLVEFNSVKFLTHFESNEPFAKNHCVKIQQIDSTRAYSFFMLSELNSYFDTDFVLVVQHDGFILDTSCWTNEFLNYDYIGAPWPHIVLDDGVPGHFNIGNGGFSLRSKKLHKILQKDINIIKNKDEDKAIGQINRAYLEYHHNIRYAPEHLASKFSFEYLDWLDRPIPKTFGGHNCYIKKDDRDENFGKRLINLQ